MKHSATLWFSIIILCCQLIYTPPAFALEGGVPGGPGDGVELDSVHPSFDLMDLRPLGFNEKIGGMDFLPDGRLVVCTWTGLLSNSGGVFIISNIDQNDRSLITYKQIAYGLSEPLGVKVYNGAIYVAEKKQVTQLVDTNGDDIIDQYNVFATGFPVTNNFHMFSFGLELKNGYFWMSLSNCVIAGGFQCPADHPDNVVNRGSLLRIVVDPSKGIPGSWEIVATGLRSPNGIGTGVDGELFGGDNQGTWLPSDKINHYRTDDTQTNFHTNFGHQNSIPSLYQSLAPTRPAIYLDHGTIGLSPSQVALVPSGAPFSGQMLHGDVALGGIKRDFMEKVAGEYQGVVFRFSQGLEAGVNRLIWRNGDLFVGGIGDSGNWNQPGKLLFGLQRLRPNGKTTFEMQSVKSRANGFEIEFTAPLDYEAALNPANYIVKHWHYTPTEAYGGQRIDEANLTVSHVDISSDYKKVYLNIPGLVPGKVVYFKLNHIRSLDSTYPWSTEAFYTLNNISTSVGPNFEVATNPPTPVPRPADNPANVIQGLNTSKYQGSWSSLPNFDALVPVTTSSAAAFDITPSSAEDNFGYVFQGFIYIAQEEGVTFYTSSDDGSRLWVGSKVVVDNNGLHGTQEASGSIFLKPGLHAIKVEYFDAQYDSNLVVSYQSSSIPKTVIPASVLYRNPSAEELRGPYYEAEKGGLSGTCIANDHLGFNGSGFVGCFGNAGSSTRIAVKANYAGDYQVKARYGRYLVPNSPTQNGLLDIYVNNVFVKSAVFPVLSSWDHWGDSTETLTLNTGVNIIEYRNTRGLEGAINLDRIEVVKRFTGLISQPAPVTCPSTDYGIDCRQNAVPYLAFPSQDPGGNFSNLPSLLSQTGAFTDVVNLIPSIGLVSFEPIAPLWSDRATKRRWISLPTGTSIEWSLDGDWRYPNGTVMIKHFELPVDELNSNSTRRLETRFLIKTPSSWYGATYRWRSDYSDADLLVDGLNENFSINTSNGQIRNQTWVYPKPADCMTCHNAWTSGALGPKTGQLNSEFVYLAPNKIDNQLRTWNHLGFFSAPLNESLFSSYQKFANLQDSQSTVENRLRSYLDANCSQCHGADPTMASLWDARYRTPLAQQGIIQGTVVGQDVSAAQFIVDAGNLQNSELFRRDNIRGPEQMPPLGSQLTDPTYLALLTEWINELPVRDDNFDLFGDVINLIDEQGKPIAPLQASLLPDGKVHIIGMRRTQVANEKDQPVTGILTNSGIYDPAPSNITLQSNLPPYDVVSVTNATAQINDSLNCAGHTLLANGDLFFAGGTRSWLDLGSGNLTSLGLPYAMLFSPVTSSYTRIPSNFVAGGPLLPAPHRCFSTSTRLPDSRVLISGGFEVSAPAAIQSANRGVEIYDPTSNQMTLIASHALAPSVIQNFDYTQVFQLPGRESGEVLMIGAAAQPVFFSVTTGQFSESNQKRPGSQIGENPNQGASSVLLPLRQIEREWGYGNGTVLSAGGKINSSHEHSVDLYDPLGDEWIMRMDMVKKRQYPSTVLLPDGKLLVLGGDDSSASNANGKAQILDGKTGIFHTGTADMLETRGENTLSLLLPDGRIWIGGGLDKNLNDKEKANFRYYYPPYIYKPRPLLFTDDINLSVGGNGLLIWLSDNSVSEVVLMGLGSVSHSFDSSQRHVQARILAETPLGVHESGLNWGAIYYQIPESPSVVPPGYYMLMVLDQKRAPSMARIIKVN